MNPSPTPAPDPVAIIDIGSNSIKVLVATRGPDNNVRSLKTRTIDSRISAGISHAQPMLSEAGIGRGVAAVRDLLEDARSSAAKRIVIVATSAVRDAHNGEDFRARVRAETGHDVRILSGAEEANLIGRGLTCDPALADLRDFYVFDLGGGSLECLCFRDRRVAQAVSLQLGCVRLTEKFVADSTQPFTSLEETMVAAHCRTVLDAAGFQFARGAVAIGTGGTITTARAILGARRGLAFDATRPVVSMAEIRELLTWLGGLSLVERQRVSGLPPARADIFPTALATFLALGTIGGFSEYRNSLYNLRYGLADEMLS